MTRTPLRPLARILPARAAGQSPDEIERENRAARHEEMRDTARQRAEGRLLVLGVFFFCAFMVVGVRMGMLATSEPVEPRASAQGAAISAARADIVDRKGRLLATNFETHALYAQPPQMIDPVRAARELAAIFPDLKEEKLVRDFTGKRKFLWVRKKISPEQMQAVHEIGDPGLLFGPREMRLYPNGSLAAHVMGGASFGKEGVHAAEVIGVAGVEKYFDDYLRDPANGQRPLELSLDLTVQAAAERVLYGGMKIMNAKGATSILMDVHTGEVISVVSLPDFDPNNRPRPATSGDQSDSPLFNRSVQGVYELGSTFKIFTAAQAVDLGLVSSNTIIDTKGPMRVGGFPIGEFRNKNYGKLTVSDIIVKSSNRGTGRMALDIGVKRQQEFLKSLGFFEATPFEIIEARTGKPLLPKRW
ncbi:MAG: penicillin-binding transpeptidase domain-containing protein, partial [Pseudomonadota bacterium]